MHTNIDKTWLISKGPIGSKVILATMSMLLLGFKVDRCSASLASELPNHQAASGDDISSLEEDSGHFLGVVSFFKADHNLGLIQVDPETPFRIPESKKTGLLFYASRSLKDCATMHLSKKGVGLSYFDGTSEVLSTCIEVDGQWLEGLSKKKVEPLFDKDGHSRLQATYTKDSDIFSGKDDGIKLLNDTNSLLLPEGSQDKARFEDVHHAGFMVAEPIPASTSELAQLVIRLSRGTVQDTDMICPASVYGNRL